MSLRLDGVRHIYASPNGGEARAILDLSAWSLAAGEQLLLRGVSGSGKTTLLNIIAGILRPTEGEVSLDGERLYSLPEAARDRFRARAVGYVFQNHHLIPSLTALENVVAPMAFAAAEPAGRWRERATALLEQVGLGAFAGYLPRQLSTGQRLRVAVARALANTPKIILADEPTAALDAEAGAAVMDLLQTTAHTTDAILLLASHDPALESRFTQIVYLRAGRFTPAEVLA